MTRGRSLASLLGIALALLLCAPGSAFADEPLGDGSPEWFLKTSRADRESWSLDRRKEIELFPHAATLYGSKDEWSPYFEVVAGPIDARAQKRLSLAGTDAVPGDVVLLNRSHLSHPLVLVYLGERKFPDVEEPRSFFAYPYSTGLEINTFPPRTHERIYDRSALSSLLDAWRSLGGEPKYVADDAHDVRWKASRKKSTKTRAYPILIGKSWRGRTDYSILRPRASGMLLDLEDFGMTRQASDDTCTMAASADALYYEFGPNLPAGVNSAIVSEGGFTRTIVAAASDDELGALLKRWGWVFKLPASAGYWSKVAGGKQAATTKYSNVSPAQWRTMINQICSTQQCDASSRKDGPLEVLPIAAVFATEEMWTALRDHGRMTQREVSSAGEFLRALRDLIGQGSPAVFGLRPGYKVQSGLDKKWVSVGGKQIGFDLSVIDPTAAMKALHKSGPFYLDVRGGGQSVIGHAVIAVGVEGEGDEAKIIFADALFAEALLSRLFPSSSYRPGDRFVALPGKDMASVKLPLLRAPLADVWRMVEESAGKTSKNNSTLRIWSVVK